MKEPVRSCAIYDHMSHRPTIIVTEDEQHACPPFAQPLADAGYDIVEAENAGDALDLLAEVASTVSVLITDTRPGGHLEGVALAQNAARHWPWIKLLVVSGEAPDRLANVPSRCDVLPRSIDPAQVVEKVKTLTGKP